jgi:hypothetical protein
LDSDEDLARAFFDRFATAFATFDGARVGELFAAPGVALRDDGTLVALTTHDDIVRYYQAALDHYRAERCRSCRWSNIQTIPMGRASLLASVTWDLLRADSTVLASWRQSYCLRKSPDGVAIFASSSHSR